MPSSAEAYTPAAGALDATATPLHRHGVEDAVGGVVDVEHLARGHRSLQRPVDGVQRIGQVLALIEDRRGREREPEQPLHGLLAEEGIGVEVLGDAHRRAGRVAVGLPVGSVGKHFLGQLGAVDLPAAVAPELLADVALAAVRRVPDDARELGRLVLVEPPPGAGRAALPASEALDRMVVHRRLRRCRRGLVARRGLARVGAGLRPAIRGVVPGVAGERTESGEPLGRAHQPQQLLQLRDRQIVVLEAFVDAGERHQRVEQQRQIVRRERQVVCPCLAHALDQRIELGLPEGGKAVRVGGIGRGGVHEDEDDVGRGAGQGRAEAARSRACRRGAGPPCHEPLSSSARSSRASATVIGASTALGQRVKRPRERRLVINQYPVPS